MFRYGFIANVPEASPETYSCVYETEAGISRINGVSSFEMTEELVKELDREGCTIIDLCGDFEDEDVENLLKVTTREIRIRHADYFPEEMERVEALESFEEYGLIIVMPGVEETKKCEMKGSGGNIYPRFVKDLKEAKIAAMELVNSGVYFIELCGWFDKEKTEAIIEAIDSKVPVGSCGIVV